MEAVLLGGAREHQPEHDDRLVHDGNSERKGTGRREFICNNKTMAELGELGILGDLGIPLLVGLKREQGSCSMAPLPEALLASSWSSMAASSVSWKRVPRITESSEWQSERSRDVDVED